MKNKYNTLKFTVCCVNYFDGCVHCFGQFTLHKTYKYLS